MELHYTFQTHRVLAMFQETGSFDPDVLDWRKSELLRRARTATRKGTVFVLLGLGATATVVGAPIGVPLLWIGCRLRGLGARHARSVERAFERYTRPSAQIA